MAVHQPLKPPRRQELTQLLAQLVTQRLEPDAVAQADWPTLIDLAGLNFLAPLLRWRLKQHFEDLDNDPRFTALADYCTRLALVSQVLWENQARLQQAFSQAALPVVWLKGLHLAQRYYPQPHLRAMSDLDVWAPASHVDKMLEVCGELGFQPLAKTALEARLMAPRQAIFHHILSKPDLFPVKLEVHLRLLEPEVIHPAANPQLEWFWQQTESWAYLGVSYTVLKPEANLLYQCAHTILQHGEGENRLQRFYDLHLLTTRSELDWGLVVDKAVELRWTYAVERALSITQQYFTTPLPGGWLDELQRRRRDDEDTSRVMRLQGEGFRWESTWLQLKSYPAGERRRRLLLLAFPPQEYLRQRYNIPPNRMAWPYYFYRWLDAAGEMLKAGLQRGRNHSPRKR